MSSCYISKIKIAVEPSQIWLTIIQQDFVRHFLPEINRDFSNVKSETPLYFHLNPNKLLPAYVIPGITISWDNNANTAIRLIRKDLNANISSIDIDLAAADGYTKVTLEVNYKPKLDANFFLTHASVRSLFSNKLRVLKNDIESKTTAAVCSASYG